jgi:hypothetical protein
VLPVRGAQAGLRAGPLRGRVDGRRLTVDGRPRDVFALVLVLVIAVTGGAALVLSDIRPALGDLGGPDVPDSGPFIRGVVVEVDARSLADVRSFTLRLGDKTFGEQFFDFQVGELENASEFPPAHLLEHQATAEPVRVFYREEDGVRYATRIEDAGN